MILKFCYIKNIKEDIFPHCEAKKNTNFYFTIYMIHIEQSIIIGV